MSSEFLDKIESYINRFSCGDYFDIRVVFERGRSLRMENGRITTNKLYNEKGLHARVYYNGHWGSATSSSIDRGSLLNTLEKACIIARTSSTTTSQKSSLGNYKVIESSYEWPIKRSFDDVDLSAKISDMQMVNGILEAKEYVKSVMVRLNEWIEDRVIYTSEGTKVREVKPYIYFAAMATGSVEGRNITAYKNIGRINGYTIFDDISQEEFALAIIDKLEKQAKAKSVKPDKYETIVSPDLVGTLVHEAFGHLAEADFVLSGSVLKEYKGKGIAPDFIYIRDVPEVSQGFGNIKFDDEGTQARDAVIVYKGIVKEFMTDRERAFLLDQKPTGNARSEGYRVQPLIRMRNTILAPGDWRIEELVEDIDYGVLLGTPLGGEANLDGTFQVGIQDAYEIVKGEIRDPVRVSSITGNSIKMLRHSVGISKDFHVDYGFCGKIQWVPVSSGGPYLRVAREGAPSLGAV